MTNDRSSPSFLILISTFVGQFALLNRVVIASAARLPSRDATPATYHSSDPDATSLDGS